MIERDPTGARWFASYVRQPHKPGQPVELHCPDHPETRLMRVLGRAWTCPECIRARSKTGGP
ncbi:hypothetical protein [Streptomyces rimosus]|uniref:hypothetical protein n=1 Tax=Streptomyces rimosus TaxID=1927 RepID=UPI0037D83BB0